VRAGGTVVVGADAGVAAVQALVRWDPAGSAARELAERGELDFPPVSRMASLTGSPTALAELLAGAHLPLGAQVVGPVPADRETERILVRVAREHGADLATALKAAAAGRSARRSAEPVRIALDPLEPI
jgi:primosomal protein N' (replication factor Y)